MKKTKETTKKEKSFSKKRTGYTPAVGRRKSAIARVRLFKGKGKMLVNDLPINEYFSGEVAKVTYLEPFKLTKTSGKYYATIKVLGSGKQAQLEATVHGLARALDKENEELYHTVLKKAGLLTRDPRAKERRKPGLGGRARGKKQSPKR